MRLDKLTIGSAKDSSTHQFKNLKNVTIDFDQEHWVTVVIGWNGTGKSNVLEALALIFRDLIAKKRSPAFAFQLAYRMGAGETLQHIHIDADPDREKDAFLIRVANAEQIKQNELTHSLLDFGNDAYKALQAEPIKLIAFLNADAQYLPRFVFSYYSGESPRMHEVFRPYLESYDSKLRNGDDPGLKRLFYAMPVHSQFVLLAFLIQQSEVIKAFLDDHLGLDPNEGIESVLFVLRQPPWKSKAVDGDPRFWNARGVVRDFLSRLYDIVWRPSKSAAACRPPSGTRRRCSSSICM
jgi:energy-coupling factor transporter ATP-binding protein EcfA2